MAKKQRKYGDAWKDVQIDAEQNDAVFDRFFRRTLPQHTEPSVEPQQPENLFDASPQPETLPSKIVRRGSQSADSKATVKTISPPSAPASNESPDIAAQVEPIRQQYRLSKGEVAILKHLLQLAQKAGLPECYTKIPLLAEACEMTHRGCQFALKNLQARGLIARIENYDPANRLGIKFQINMPV